MSPRERKLIAFIAMRLDSMLSRPKLWGGARIVEENVFQLLEMRHLLLDATAVPTNNTSRLMAGYTKFIEREIPDATAETLAAQLERTDRLAEFGDLLRKFVSEDAETLDHADDRDQADENDAANDHRGARRRPPRAFIFPKHPT